MGWTSTSFFEQVVIFSFHNNRGTNGQNNATVKIGRLEYCKDNKKVNRRAFGMDDKPVGEIGASRLASPILGPINEYLGS